MKYDLPERVVQQAMNVIRELKDKYIYAFDMLKTELEEKWLDL